MTDLSASVDHLSGLAGIEPYYFDIHGVRHEATLATKVRVLTAFGIDVSSANAAENALREFESAPWRRTLPKTTFRDADVANVVVDIVLPATGKHAWRWELELETGEVRSGEFRADELESVAAKEIDGRRLERRRLVFTQPLPAGYHRLCIVGRAKSVGTIVTTPRRCYLPQSLEGGQRLWGLATHIYALRSQENCGIGDFADLKRLTRMVAQSGGSFVAVNPFHALSPERPEHASPYSPSSRLFVNPLYVGSAPWQGATDDLRSAEFVNYTGVWSAKGKALEKLGETRAGSSEAEFEAYCRAHGEALDRFAAFATLSETLGADYPSWHAWPVSFRNAGTAAVKRFAAEHADRVRFHKYLQFLADRQQREVASEGEQGGMGIGLIRDLALGVDPDGADAWADQEAFLGDLRCGAPRDDFNPEGQEWGVLPLNPLRLRSDHRIYADLLRANMRHAGGLRIDHIIGIDRQFVVPLGGSPADGCYLRYPTDELLGLIALESWRNKCMVFGEDLGMVPDGLRQRMHDAQLFGCSIFYFERGDSGAFRAPEDYRKHSIASAGTHDLPTIAGYWAGRDIEAQATAGIKSGMSADDAIARRAEDKRRLVEALVRAGVLAEPGNMPDGTTLRDAVHVFLSQSAAQLFAAQLDDLLGEIMQLNLPGTVDTYPNWRRKLHVSLEDTAFMQALSGLGRMARGRSRPGSA